MWDAVNVFTTVFFAELGDKNQLATFLFASEARRSPILVFVVAGSALLLSTGLPVLLGRLAGTYFTRVPLQLISGLVFTVVGLWTILNFYRGVPD